MQLSLFTFIIFVWTWSSEVEEWKTTRINGFAQGTTYTVTYYSQKQLVDKFHVDSVLRSIDSSVSLYKSYSFINRFNNSEKGLKLQNKHFSTILQKSMKVYRDTDDLFDITVQPLVQLWGFGVTKTDTLPAKKAITDAKQCVGNSLLRIENNFLKKDKSCVRLDMNGIAQGYSVDVLANFLESKEIKNYLVELGGEIRVKGLKQPFGEIMKIGIESPDADEFGDSSLQKIISFKEGAIATSGSYRNYYESNGRRISHIINPKSGYPVQNELISVTVYAKDAMTADAYDNAIMLMGLEKGMKFIEKRKHLAAYFIYKNKDGQIADTATTRFRNLFND